jgi:hypothetical protein
MPPALPAAPVTRMGLACGEGAEDMYGLPMFRALYDNDVKTWPLRPRAAIALMASRQAFASISPLIKRRASRLARHFAC